MACIWAGRRERPFRFLLDSRFFRHLCDPGRTAALDSFRASLERLGLAPEDGLPDPEMTPLAILDVIGVEPPRFPALPYLPKSMATLEDIEVGLRAFLDEIPREELAGELRSFLRAWTPGWLVPCREDGTLEAAVSTGEVPIWAGPPSPPAPLPRAGEGSSSAPVGGRARTNTEDRSGEGPEGAERRLGG